MNRTGVERDLPGFHLGDEKQIPDQSQQPIGVSLDDRDELPLIVVELAGVAFAQQLQIAPDRGQGRAQLV